MIPVGVEEVDVGEVDILMVEEDSVVATFLTKTYKDDVLCLISCLSTTTDLDNPIQNSIRQPPLNRPIWASTQIRFLTMMVLLRTP